MEYNTINNDVTMPGNGRSLPGNRTIDNDVTMPGDERALLANRYRVVKQLGQGGMGSVWLAEDTQLDNKQFAIKMLPSILVSNKRAYRQLKDEALVAMKLVHPNIVQLRAFEENNGNPFLVMDYIDGQSLDDYLEEKGKLSEDEAIKLLKPIAVALDYAHGEGVVHRDVKPGNVMIRKDGRPFVLDFGIAREIQETMTRVTGKLSSGTLLYMSPEQLRGQPPKPAQDVYGFAAMAYECIKGEPPFTRGAIEDQIKNESPQPLSGGACAASIMSGLAKTPEDRPPSCVAVLGGSSGCVDQLESVPNKFGRTLAVLAMLSVLAAGGYVLRLVFHHAESPSGERCIEVIDADTSDNVSAPSETNKVTHVPMPQENGIANIGGPPPDTNCCDEEGVNVITPTNVECRVFTNGECKVFLLLDRVEMEMVYIDPGNDASPYWIGKYPVTQEQWEKLSKASGASFANGTPKARFSEFGSKKDVVKGVDTSDFPMENISWNDCDSLLKALNKKENSTEWRLPTAEQLEIALYLCDGVKRRLDGGDSGEFRPHSIKEYPENRLGIVGVDEGFHEWCRDLFYDERMNDGSVEPQLPDFRVWYGNGSKSSRAPGFRSVRCGFRLCRLDE